MQRENRNLSEINIITRDKHIVRNDITSGITSQRVCLLIHGLTGDRHEHGLFDDLKEYLESKEFIVVRIALRGHDASAISLNHSSLAGMMADAYTAIQTLQANYNTVNVIGLSLGGGIINMLADGLQPNRIVMLNPVTSFRSVLAQAMTTHHKLAPISTHHLSSRFVLQALTRRMNRANTTGVPTLLLHATDDAIVPVKASRFYASKRDHVIFEEIPNDDHLLQNQRKYVVERTVNWLEDDHQK